MTAISSTSAHPEIIARPSKVAEGVGFDDFMVGQTVSIKVQRRLDEQHYLVVLRGDAKKVMAAHPLPVGEVIDAVVVSNIGILELQVRESRVPDERHTDSSANALITLGEGTIGSSDVKQIADFYRRDLSITEQSILQEAVDASQSPENMLLGGLFLSKKNIPIQTPLLNALYALQVSTQIPADTVEQIALHEKNDVLPVTIGSMAVAIRNALASDSDTASDKAKEGIDALDSSNTVASDAVGIGGAAAFRVTGDHNASGGAADDEGAQQFVRQLLNDLNADAGVRYGTLPVLIDGRLVELEVVMFHHRQPNSDVEPLRRLVMSIQTDSLGTVQVTAEALNNRLLIQISSDSSDHTATLASYVQDVRELAERFGWVVESVNYDIAASSKRLAQRVMEHEVRQGVIDHVW